MTSAIPPSPESILANARLLNSSLGQHSVKCSFSTRLSGRFYQNSSLEQHRARKSRLVEMQARKRRLEKELRVEERRVRLLEGRLEETEKAREEAHELIGRLSRGIVGFQTVVRRNQAVSRYIEMRHRARTRKYIALFLQSNYRGWKGRERVHSMRCELRRRIMNESAVRIQAEMRRRIQRRQYIDLLSKIKLIGDKSASSIQALLRGKMTRKMYHEEMVRRQSAALNVQRVFRGKIGRDEYDRLKHIMTKKAEKPKRIPLHMRRYSTYGTVPRKPSKKRDVTQRRRSSVEDMSSLSRSLKNEQDENDSVATTLTSLTHTTHATELSRRRVPRGKMADSTNTNKGRNKNSWPATHRVLAVEQKNKSETKSKSPDASEAASRSSRSTAQNIKTDKDLASRVPTFVAGNLAPSSSETAESRKGSEKRRDGVPSYVSAGSPQHGQHASNDAQNDTPELGTEKPALHSEMQASCEETKTRITISREASLIVEEVLGRTIIMHSIVTCGFDDQFSEHEDDLE